MSVYAYTTDWNHWDGMPMPGHRWLSVAEARERYETNQPFDVVQVTEGPDDQGAVRGRCIMGFAGLAGVRVQWLTDKHTIYRLNDYTVIDGRLFRWVSTDYEYPDNERRYGFSETTMMRRITVSPDGTGSVLIDDVANRRRKTIPFDDYRTDNLWMDRPEFGEWAQLTNIAFGDE